MKNNFSNIEETSKFNILSNLRGDSFCAEPDCSVEPKEHNKKSLSLTKKKELLEKAQGQSTRDIEKMLVETDSSCVFYHDEKVRFVGYKKIELKVTLDEDCFKNLENLKNLLSHKNPRMSYRELIALLAELGLKKYDPSKKINQKSLQTASLPNAKQNKNVYLNQSGSKKSFLKQQSDRKFNRLQINTEKSLSEHTTQIKSKKNSRYIPQKIRQSIWKRDQGECSYICPKTKNKCRSKHLLQIDHIQPFALGGKLILKT